MSATKRKVINLQTLLDKGIISAGAKAEFYFNRDLYCGVVEVDETGTAQFKFTTKDNVAITGKDPSAFIKSVVKQVTGNILPNVSGSNEMIINGKSIQQWKDAVPDEPATNASNEGAKSPEQKQKQESQEPKSYALKSLETLERSFSQMGLDANVTPKNAEESTQKSENAPIHIPSLSYVSASGIGRYFHLNCHRYLAFSTISKSERGKKIKYFQAPHSNILQQASIDGGFVWEQFITDHYLGGPENVVSPADHNDDVEIQHKKSVKALRETPSGKYIVQACFLPAPSLWRNLPRSLVQFSRSYPDFLQITQNGDKKTVVILDAKSTAQAKFSQQVQVAFYFLLLQTIIDEEKIQDVEISTTGGIWLKGKKEVNYFNILPVLLILESFLYGDKETDLQALLSVPKQLADWHMLPVCSGCDFFDVCHTEAEHENTLSQVAYLAKPTRTMLLNFRSSFTSAIPQLPPLPPSPSKDCLEGTEIEDLHKLLEGFQVQKINKFENQMTILNGPTLANLKIAAPRIEATRYKKVVLTGSVNVDFSTEKEDVSIYVSFLSNPETNLPYAWAVRIEDVEHGVTFACGEEISVLVLLLSNAFQTVHEYNLNATSWQGCKSLQCYIFDKHEQALLLKTLLNQVLSANDTTPQPGFTSALVVVLLAFLHTSDWLGFGGAAPLPSRSSYQKSIQSKPKPDLDNDPTKKLDFSDPSFTPPKTQSPPKTRSPHTNFGPTPGSNPAFTISPTDPNLTNTPTPVTPLSTIPSPIISGSSPSSGPTMPSSPSILRMPGAHNPMVDANPTTPLPHNYVPPTPLSPTLLPTFTHSSTPSTPLFTPSPDTPSTPPSVAPTPVPPKKESWRNMMSCSPTIVVQNLVSTMLALPYFPVYDITACAKYILEKAPELPIDSENIFKEWKKSKQIEERVKDMLRHRLTALSEIVKGVRRPEFIGTKQKRPNKFSLRPRLQLSNPLVSRMLFTEEYELASSCTKIRNERSQPLSVRVQQGKVIKLTVNASDISVITPKRGNPSATYDSYFVIASLDEAYGKIPQPDFAFEFPWLVTQNTIDGENAIYQFDDAVFQDGIPSDLGKSLGLARVEATEPNYSYGFTIQLRVKLRKKSDVLRNLLDDPTAKMELILHEKFLVGITFPTIHQHALEMDELCKEGRTPILLQIISSPKQWISVAPEDEFGTPLKYEADRVIHELADFGLKMHPSQAILWDKLAANRLQLVWGPPGTGKTHFLALSILILLETHRRLNIPYTIGVTAFTHIALEHLLAKLSSLQEIASKSFSIIKLGGVTTQEGSVANISSKDPGKEGIEPGTLPPHCVVGGTVWRLRKAFRPHGDVLDCLVIDESTQLPVLEASIATQFINEKQGRLILAGDHKQLGPIRVGEYPVSEDSTSIQLHKSIFVCLKHALSPSAELKNRLMGTLLENMRMNEDLCNFAAQNVYTPDYKPFYHVEATPAAAVTVANFFPERSLSNLVLRILSDSRSMVVVLLPAAANIATQSWEAQITALLALELFRRSGLSMDVYGFAEFWRKQLFVVTPQHFQRLATRSALQKAGFSPEHLFVDTVEKMQGQEAETVIVSYGSYQWANSSSEFVFNRNRLNVCTSRARSRCIVLLLEDLLSPSPAVLDNPSTKKAFYYLVSLVNFAKVFHLRDFT
eukprot:Phypoly_transcript_00356.p1 GENE.Phypoly_transcript_00356~~Phypoly_transcript_00356.p1  ORF type:complete len:1651 (+),score=274.07 Phypoly_transcript_00356:129-5081(+)